MKKIVYLLIALLMFSACRKDNHKEEEFLICCDTPCLRVKLQIKENLIPEDLLEKVAIYEETSEGKVKANIVYNFKKDGKEYKIKYFKIYHYLIFMFPSHVITPQKQKDELGRDRTCNPQIRSLMRFHCATSPIYTSYVHPNNL